MTEQKAEGDRPLFEGEWECSQCGAAITQLPFQPDAERPLFCRECHRKRRAEREVRKRSAMVQGSWTCVACGGDISELPFNPTRTDNLLCRQCHREKRMAQA